MSKIKKSIKKAVALGYQKEKNSAPKVLASGKGESAAKIISLAKEHGVPIKEDEDLIEILSKLDLGDEIPPICIKLWLKFLLLFIKWQIKHLKINLLFFLQI